MGRGTGRQAVPPHVRCQSTCTPKKSAGEQGIWGVSGADGCTSSTEASGPPSAPSQHCHHHLSLPNPEPPAHPTCEPVVEAKRNTRQSAACCSAPAPAPEPAPQTIKPQTFADLEGKRGSATQGKRRRHEAYLLMTVRQEHTRPRTRARTRAHAPLARRVLNNCSHDTCRHYAQPTSGRPGRPSARHLRRTAARSRCGSGCAQGGMAGHRQAIGARMVACCHQRTLCRSGALPRTSSAPSCMACACFGTSATTTCRDAGQVRTG